MKKPKSPPTEEQIADSVRLRNLFSERAGMSQLEFGQAYGVGNQGMVWQYLNANGFLSSVGQKPLFCYDGDIGTGQAHKIATNAINDHLAKSPGDSKKEIVEVLLMMKLKAMHPC